MSHNSRIGLWKPVVTALTALEPILELELVWADLNEVYQSESGSRLECWDKPTGGVDSVYLTLGAEVFTGMGEAACRAVDMMRFRIDLLRTLLEANQAELGEFIAEHEALLPPAPVVAEGDPSE